MTPAEFRAIRIGLNLTQAQAARLLGLSERVSIARYETGMRAVPPPVARLMLLMRDVKPALHYVANIANAARAKD